MMSDTVTDKKRGRKPSTAAVVEVKTTAGNTGNQPAAAADVYIVEKVLEDRRRRGKTEYYIKWLNFTEAENSWEPANNILDKRLIIEYKIQKEKAAETGQGNLKRKAAKVTQGDKKPAEGNSEMLDVEDVVGIRRNEGRVEYLVKWVGYSEDENTWEPENHIRNKAMLKKFSLPEEKERKKPGRKPN